MSIFHILLIFFFHRLIKEKLKKEEAPLVRLLWFFIYLLNKNKNKSRCKEKEPDGQWGVGTDKNSNCPCPSRPRTHTKHVHPNLTPLQPFGFSPHRHTRDDKQCSCSCSCTSLPIYHDLGRFTFECNALLYGFMIHCLAISLFSIFFGHFFFLNQSIFQSVVVSCSKLSGVKDD